LVIAFAKHKTVPRSPKKQGHKNRQLRKNATFVFTSVQLLSPAPLGKSALLGVFDARMSYGQSLALVCIWAHNKETHLN
jgi:hypothetical protein